MLAKWLDWEASALPKDADTIIEYCSGSPMVIAMIGAILKKNPNSERKWKLIVDKLKNKHFQSIKLHASVNEWSYQHATLNASIELSVESLPQHLQVHLSTYWYRFTMYMYMYMYLLLKRKLHVTAATVIIAHLYCISAMYIHVHVCTCTLIIVDLVQNAWSTMYCTKNVHVTYACI